MSSPLVKQKSRLCLIAPQLIISGRYLKATEPVFPHGDIHMRSSRLTLRDIPMTALSNLQHRSAECKPTSGSTGHLPHSNQRFAVPCHSKSASADQRGHFLRNRFAKWHQRGILSPLRVCVVLRAARGIPAIRLAGRPPRLCRSVEG